MAPLLAQLPEDSRAKALVLKSDGLAATKQLICTSKHVLESSARTVSTAVALCRFGWLGTTSLSSEAKSIIEDMAFDGLGLFNAETDTMLRRLDKNIKASRLLGITSRPYNKKRPFKPWQRPARSPDRYSRQSSSFLSRSSSFQTKVPAT